MDSEKFKGQWRQFKGKVKKQWGKLTDDDVDVIEGDWDIMVGKIQERYGISREEAEHQAEQWADSVGSTGRAKHRV